MCEDQRKQAQKLVHDCINMKKDMPARKDYLPV